MTPPLSNEKKDFAKLAAKDVMTRNVISVKKDSPIYEALSLLVKNDITGVPVVEDDMTLVGILSEQDCLRLVYSPEDGLNKIVSDFMTQPAVHFDETESMLDVCECLMNHFFRRVPITSNGKLVGIITRRNIICTYFLNIEQSSNISTGLPA